MVMVMVMVMGMGMGVSRKMQRMEGIMSASPAWESYGDGHGDSDGDGDGCEQKDAEDGGQHEREACE
jgi:hypothetical protein